MMQKFILAGVVVALAVLVVAIILGFRGSSGIFSPSVSPTLSNTTQSSLPKSAFAPESPSVATPQIQEPKWEPTPASKIKKPTPPPTVAIPSIEEIKKRIFESVKEDNALQNRLALPDVPDAEITLNPGGVKTGGDFLTYFSDHIKEVRLDGGKFAQVLKGENGVQLLPYELIEKGLKDKDFKSAHDSLLVYREMTNSKIAYLSSINVYGDAAQTSKDFIGLEKLTLELIDKAFAVEAGTLPIGELGQFFEKVKATAMSENAELLTRAGIAEKEKNVFDRVFGIVREVFGPRETTAQGLVFGGPISIIEPPGVCTCEPGFLLSVGPPVPTVLFVSVAWIATPALFIHYSLRPGAYWLGSYSGAPGICEALPYCEPVGLGFRPTIAGTGP